MSLTKIEVWRKRGMSDLTRKPRRLPAFGTDTEASMDGPEREQELWQEVAAAQQPDEKRRRGMREALERYYLARGLQGSGQGAGGDGGIDAIDRIDGTRRIE
ncbi:MAG: hypothetical protein NVS3B7_13780 [Candidatus Elarobacter sp.]